MEAPAHAAARVKVDLIALPLRWLSNVSRRPLDVRAMDIFVHLHNEACNTSYDLVWMGCQFRVGRECTQP